MLKALNEQSADSYYDLLESKLIPVAKQFDNDMQAFQMWSDARGKAEVSAVQSSKTRVLILIVVAALLTAGIIVLAAGAAPHAAQAALGVDCAAGKRRRGDLTHTLNAPASRVQPSERCYRRHAPVADALGAAGPRCQLAN